jgi:aryl-alcohol dehydrogenase-like predicted oxidoreductase
MRYKAFGNTGLKVSELCLGTMTFGEDWGWGASKEECSRMFRTFMDKGGNYLDTAVNYTNGTSERILGELLAEDRDNFVLGTKYTLNRRPNDPNAGGNNRKNLMSSLRQSLKQLRTDYVDILWLHAWDFTTPIVEVMRSLDDVVRSGQVRYIGASDTPAWVISRANTIAEERGWIPFSGIQIQYSLVERTSERELIPMARAFDMAITSWSPLGAGLLTGKYHGIKPGPGEARLTTTPTARNFLTDRNMSIAEEVRSIAKEVGRSSAQVALAWIRAQGKDMIPILGARNVEQLEDDIGCLDISLNVAQLNRLDAISHTDLGFPHEFVRGPFVKTLLFGKTGELLDYPERRN